jgi:hypothetical protein
MHIADLLPVNLLPALLLPPGGFLNFLRHRLHCTIVLPAFLEQCILPSCVSCVAVLHYLGGFPITLRHRLHCTIVRGANSRAPNCTPITDGSSGSGMPCVATSCIGRSVDGEEHVALNEVVIERGISPFLTNLECFCDGAFVTHVQVSG